MIEDKFDSIAKGSTFMAEYSVPKKNPYIVRLEKGQTLSTVLKRSTPNQNKAIKDSAEKFENRNIRKGW